jgi:hypothetical protein
MASKATRLVFVVATKVTFAKSRLVSDCVVLIGRSEDPEPHPRSSRELRAGPDRRAGRRHRGSRRGGLGAVGAAARVVDRPHRGIRGTPARRHVIATDSADDRRTTPRRRPCWRRPPKGRRDAYAGGCPWRGCSDCQPRRCRGARPDRRVLRALRSGRDFQLPSLYVSAEAAHSRRC